MSRISERKSKHNEHKKSEESFDNHDFRVLRFIGNYRGDLELGVKEGHPLVRLEKMSYDEGRVDEESELCPKPLHREAERSKDRSGEVVH